MALATGQHWFVDENKLEQLSQISEATCIKDQMECTRAVMSQPSWNECYASRTAPALAGMIFSNKCLLWTSPLIESGRDSLLDSLGEPTLIS